MKKERGIRKGKYMMMNLDSRTLRFLLAVIVLSTAACTSQSQKGARNPNAGPGVGPKFGEQFIVGYVPLDNPKNEYWKAYDEGLRKAIEDAGAKLLYFSGQGDPVKQHDSFSQLVAQDVDMLLVYPIDSNAIGAAIQEANAADIPVGVLWNPVPAASKAKIVMTISMDDEIAAARSAQAIVDGLTKKYGEPRGTVLEVQGRMVTTGGIRRGAGFHKVIDEYPDIKVTSKPGDWDTGKGTNVIQQWINAYPDTDAIFFHSDGAYTPAAIAALSPIGRWQPAGEEGHIIIAGIDGSNIAVHAIKHGYMEYTSGAEHADVGGFLGSLAMEFLQSGAAPQVGEKILRPETTWKAAEVVEIPTYAGPLVFIPVTSITQENADDRDLFANKYQGSPNGLSECQWE